MPKYTDFELDLQIQSSIEDWIGEPSGSTEDLDDYINDMLATKYKPPVSSAPPIRTSIKL